MPLRCLVALLLGVSVSRCRYFCNRPADLFLALPHFATYGEAVNAHFELEYPLACSLAGLLCFAPPLPFCCSHPRGPHETSCITGKGAGPCPFLPPPPPAGPSRPSSLGKWGLLLPISRTVRDCGAGERAAVARTRLMPGEEQAPPAASVAREPKSREEALEACAEQHRESAERGEESAERVAAFGVC